MPKIVSDLRVLLESNFIMFNQSKNQLSLCEDLDSEIANLINVSKWWGHQNNLSFKPGLHCAICSTFYSIFYVLEILWWMFYELKIYFTYLWPSKLNKRSKRTFLLTQLNNKQNLKAWFPILKILFTYIAFAFIFSTFSIYLWCVV